MFNYEVVGCDFPKSHCFEIGTLVRLTDLSPPPNPKNNTSQNIYEDREGTLQILSSTEVKYIGEE